MMKHHRVEVEDIVIELCEKFNRNLKKCKKISMGQISFSSRELRLTM